MLIVCGCHVCSQHCPSGCHAVAATDGDSNAVVLLPAAFQHFLRPRSCRSFAVDPPDVADWFMVAADPGTILTCGAQVPRNAVNPDGTLTPYMASLPRVRLSLSVVFDLACTLMCAILVAAVVELHCYDVHWHARQHW